MAIANHVGHNKRGNKTYVRDRKGNEIIEEIEELGNERETTQKKGRTSDFGDRVMQPSAFALSGVARSLRNVR